jgi:hypothetical protein
MTGDRPTKGINMQAQPGDKLVISGEKAAVQ